MHVEANIKLLEVTLKCHIQTFLSILLVDTVPVDTPDDS